MELKVLHKNKYTIVASTNRGSCKLEDELTDEVDKSTYGQRLNIIDKLNRLSLFGLEGRENNIWLKCLDSGRGVYEIKSGVIRVFCVKGNDGLLLICTGILRKTTKKANKSEIDKAAAIKIKYDAAYVLQDIVFIEDVEDDQ